MVFISLFTLSLNELARFQPDVIPTAGFSDLILLDFLCFSSTSRVFTCSKKDMTNHLPFSAPFRLSN